MYSSNNSIITSTLLAFLFIWIGFGCNNPASSINDSAKSDNKYFDLKGYIDSEISRLSSNAAFVKTVRVNDDQEEKVLENLDLENELKPFSNSDINKPSWSDKYEVDSLFDSNGNLKELSYSAKDRDLKTQFFSVKFRNEEIVEIAIKNRSKSSVAEITENLSYAPNTGFTIESTQNVTMVDKAHFKIQVDFKK